MGIIICKVHCSLKSHMAFSICMLNFTCVSACVCIEMHVYESSIPPMFVNPKVDSLEKILLLFKRDKSIVNE